MGEIAEMMLEGSMCQNCGEYLGEGDGFPVSCGACEPAQSTESTSRARPSRNARRAMHQNQERAAIANRKHKCPQCGKGFRSTFAVEQHVRDKHGAK